MCELAQVGGTPETRAALAWEALVTVWLVNGAPERATRDALRAAVARAAPTRTSAWDVLETALGEFAMRPSYLPGRIHFFSYQGEHRGVGEHRLDPDEVPADLAHYRTGPGSPTEPDDSAIPDTAAA